MCVCGCKYLDDMYVLEVKDIDPFSKPAHLHHIRICLKKHFVTGSLHVVNAADITFPGTDVPTSMALEKERGIAHTQNALQSHS